MFLWRRSGRCSGRMGNSCDYRKVFRSRRWWKVGCGRGIYCGNDDDDIRPLLSLHNAIVVFRFECSTKRWAGILSTREKNRGQGRRKRQSVATSMENTVRVSGRGKFVTILVCVRGSVDSTASGGTTLTLTRAEQLECLDEWVDKLIDNKNGDNEGGGCRCYSYVGIPDPLKLHCGFYLDCELSFVKRMT